MSNLPAADRLCFNCSLEDCKENRTDCPRKKFLKDSKDIKEEIHHKKMTTILQRREPFVVR